jgi:hypothetical protein
MKPHTWTVRERVKGQVSGKATSGAPGPGTTVRGQITPITGAEAINRFGVEADNTFLALMDASDGALHLIEAEVSFGTRTFIVKADAQTYDGIGACDHAGVLLVEMKKSA